MPKRHKNDFNMIIDILEIFWNKLKFSNNEKDKHILKNFIKATYKKLNSNSLKQLEYFPNDDQYPKYLTIKEIKDEFKDILDLSIYLNGDELNNLYNNQNELNKIKTNKFYNNENNNVILSLSGGVDSILCSILCDYDFVVHINYSNRETSNFEEEFVKAWCNYLKKPLFIRRINEVNRKIC